jgi:phosphatidylethanolamine/phosphatidyl-N-methylethanolamine N-methyltransferase
MLPKKMNGARAPLDLEAVLSAYRRWAPTYDVVFGAIFQQGRTAVARRINDLPCTRVLEVGVGTGLSLPLYSRDKRVTGVDVSPEMLAQARKRISDERLDNVESLHEMDGENLQFADGAFDAVVASYVMSVVPHPQRCLAEMTRVCAPGGTILVCNHFVNGHGGFVSRRMQPLSRWLGWRPAFEIGDLLEDSPLRVEAQGAVPPFGLFQMVTLRKE